ncbi:pantoate--beta-alanine ligase [Porphyromonadaceae bacterium OttesenSCG-928-L07]|nr:pantoate--beta-alanine ligase [Porphyromonadaceae bacterium OttesenSCG-928-L07]
MKVVDTKKELTGLIEAYRNSNKTIGLVPTMGALHEGHLSLVQEANKICDISIVTIFVNPTQFNDPEDLKRYPRTPDADLALLESAGCDIVFMPSVEEVYPEKDTRQFQFGYIESIMEGAKRPGHFNGVAQIVSKLFDMVQPDKAFFGMKDFQQIAIIKNMVEQLKYNIEIVECPIIREDSGLALSSRNKLLGEEYKKNAPHIHAILKKAINLAPEMSASDLKVWITGEINKNPYLEVEYVEIVDAKTLQVVENWEEERKTVICVAVYAGKIRLIDNIVLES